MSPPGNTGRRQRLFHIQSGRCAYCDRRMRMFSPNEDDEFLCTIDEKIPLSKGGTRTRRNQVAACRSCNNAKGSQDVDVFLAAKGSRLWNERTCMELPPKVKRKREIPRIDGPRITKPPADLSGIFSGNPFAELLRPLIEQEKS